MATSPSISDLPDFARRQPTLGEVIAEGVADGARRLRVCFPAQVVSVRGNQLVDVQPLLKAVYFAKGGATPLPIVSRVPVSMPMGQHYAVTLPIDVGDTGLILCADRSLDAWMAGSGEAVDPGDDRTHALADAIFVPGLCPESGQTAETSNDLVLRNGQTQIRIERNGTVRLINDAGHELVDLSVQLIDAVTQLTNILAQSQTITMLGPSPTLWAAAQSQLAALQQQIAAIKQNTSTLRGE